MERDIPVYLKWLVGALCLCLPAQTRAQMPVYGDYAAHDPSTMIKFGTRFYVYRTSQGIMGKYSTDLRNWTYSGQVFPGSPPAWTTNAVPGFTGSFWAPDIVLLSGTYFLYYAVSTFGRQVSAIGLVTTTNLDAGPWTDQGPVIQSAQGDPYNCIDPSILLDTNGTMWMSFGSFWNGIYLVQLDPATGKRIAPTSALTRLAYNSSIEASCLYQHGGYYYLFVDWGTCCSGINSTYNIRVGRSTAVTGPYLDRNGVNMGNNGGSMFLESTARFIGPGHAGIMNDQGTNWFTYHYYDGNNNGAATLGLAPLTWAADGWPAFTNDWSAFFTFDVDAREHLGLYNGTLQSGAAITNEPSRGNALSLDGASRYVSLPNPVANASSFAAWVKWNGGGTWQRLFDFGSNTNHRLYLTPRADSGNLRFAITTNGSEQFIEGTGAMPTGSWCHVAVTLDGARGLLYVNGNPVGTNNSLTIRPWQTLARHNYIGKSQWVLDPLFNGEVDAFRIFGRALSGVEIRDLAFAHPALAHRYSFTSDASDSIGMAHGTLLGNAIVTNRALQLTGAAGDFVNLPGGLVSGSSAVTIEFWATFGTNGDWARVLDFGNIIGIGGTQYLCFSPHTGTASHQIEVSSGSAVHLDGAGTLDNRSVCVACIVDPATGYSAIYTNGVLDNAATNALPSLSGISSAWSFIGRSLSSADAWLTATIDELRIYDGRLPPDQIVSDYQFGPDALALPIQLAPSGSAAGSSLSWPSYAIGFVAESSPVLGNAAVWTPSPQPPVLNNDRWQFTPSASNAAQFWRLRR